MSFWTRVLIRLGPANFYPLSAELWLARSNFSKCFRALRMLMRVAAEAAMQKYSIEFSFQSDWMTSWILHIAQKLHKVATKHKNVILTNSRIWHNNHDICVRCKNIDERSEICISNFHTQKLWRQFAKHKKMRK